MKAIVFTLSAKECKAIEGIVINMEMARVMLNEGAKILGAQEKKLWDTLNMLYPEISEYQDKKFSFENFEVSYFMPDKDSERYKLLKEKAIMKQDFELGAKYRDLEKRAKEKEQGENDPTSK